jgi:DNA modification methylase
MADTEARGDQPRLLEVDPANDSEKERLQRERTFNGLTAREWTRLSRNVWNDVSSPRNERHLAHGAVFPLKLAERLVQMYSGPGDLVLDPFAGIGTTVVAAQRAGRRGLGIELVPEFHQMCEEWLDETSSEGSPATVVQDDCRNLSEYVAPESVQLVVTSPPYADFIHKSLEDRRLRHKTSRIRHENNSRVRVYSDDDRDLGNLPYKPFLDAIEEISHSLWKAITPKGYLIWVVKDHRDTANGVPYIPVHVDVAQRSEQAGFTWHDLIVWDQNEQRSLILLGYPSVFYSNQNCSFLVVMRKNT